MNTDKSARKLSRRAILAATGATAASSFLEGCLRPPPFRGVCPSTPNPPHAIFPNLMIDVHCHIFNGTDLQVADFLLQVQEHGQASAEAKVGIQLLQDLVWKLAPTGDKELKALKRLSKKPSRTTMERSRNKAYLKARSAMLRSIAKHIRTTSDKNAPPPPPPPGQAGQPGPPTEASVAAKIQDRLSPTSYDAYVAAEIQPARPAPTPKSLDGLIDYVIQNFHYRYVMVDDYLNAFTYSSGRCVDLIIASMVDYDWWLSGGASPKTPLKKQIEVMEQISVLSRGQVHGFVPFDPFREVAYLAGHEPNSSMALVMDAILNRGCIGVKLYPPMGFAPWGNAALGNFWSGHGLPDWVNVDIRYQDGTTAGFGQRLDDALENFYDWCCRNDVPLMVHSSMSQGPTSKFEELAGQKYWAKALEKFKGLRVDFGHLGDFSDVLDKDPPDAVEFIKLMNEGPDQPGRFAFADTGYFAAMMSQKAAFIHRLKDFYSRTPGSGKARLADRLMYGTDWNLLINQGEIKDYFENFAQALEDIDRASSGGGPTPSQRFFGYNAVNWLGLKSGQARDRLNMFYARHDLVDDPPGWLKKVDGLA